MTAEQVLALRPLDPVYVKRFRREGQVVRVNPAKQIAVVNVGLLEVEVPFDGLALPLTAEPAGAQPPAAAKPSKPEATTPAAPPESPAAEGHAETTLPAGPEQPPAGDTTASGASDVNSTGGLTEGHSVGSATPPADSQAPGPQPV